MPDAIKLVCFDLDQTLINQNSWFELGLAMGVSAELDKKFYEQFKDGQITYEEWNGLVLEEYLKHVDANRAGITKALTNYSYNPGAREAVRHVQQAGYIVVLISGSIDIIVSHVAKDLGITYAKANNTFIFDDQDRLQGIQTHGNDNFAKLQHLDSFCSLLGVKLSECVCVGDGANDLEMFKATGRGITFKDSPIEADAWKVIDSLHNLHTLLPGAY